MQTKRGFTLIELLVVIAILMVLIGLLLPALASAQRNARSAKDGVQQKEIHRAFLTWATNHEGVLPIPGQVNRLGVVPGQGAEDFTQNTSQSLYSALIAQEYLDPDILIGPTENNPVVTQYREYDYTQYNPGGNTYWDTGFGMDIADEDPDVGCNASFAHEAICGVRKSRRWRNTQDSSYPILSTRGVERGQPPYEREHEDSPTLRLHASKKVWVGNVVFADNRLQQLENFFPTQTTYTADDGIARKDNIFHCEFDFDPDPQAAPDVWLVISTVAADDGNSVEAKYDLLDN
ncbi:MAG: type II secretion system protein [Planctomycetota bacterium]